MIRFLLGAAALMTATAAPAATVAFTGALTNDTPPAGPSPLCSPGQIRIAFSPANSAQTSSSNFGGFGFTQAHCLTPPSSYSDGVFEFAFAAGDLLSGTYSGFLTPTATASVVNNTINLVVTGGTGRFLGATGAIQGVGTLDRSVPRPFNSLTLNGTLDLPAVPEPASWAMMIGGFAMVGGAARHRRRLVAVAA